MKASTLTGALTLLALPLLARDPRVAPSDAPSSADLAPPGEPGERLEVSGVVYAADGRTPVTGASVYVFQEDDPYLSPRVRADAARPGSMYALQPVRRGPGGVGRVTQDVVLPAR